MFVTGEELLWSRGVLTQICADSDCVVIGAGWAMPLPGSRYCTASAQHSSDFFSRFSSTYEPRAVDVDQCDLAKGPQQWTPIPWTVSSALYSNRLTRPRH